MSYLSRLECSQCGAAYDYDEVQTYCLACQAPLLSVYDWSKIRRRVDRDEFRRRQRGMWRWGELQRRLTGEHPFGNLRGEHAIGRGEDASLLSPG